MDKIKMWPLKVQLLSRIFVIYSQNANVNLIVAQTARVSWLLESLGFILWEPWMYEQHFIAIHQIFVEIFLSGQNDWLTKRHLLPWSHTADVRFGGQFGGQFGGRGLIESEQNTQVILFSGSGAEEKKTLQYVTCPVCCVGEGEYEVCPGFT